MSKYKPLGLDSNIPFGKHVGKVVRKVILTDLQYMRWMMREGVSFTTDVKTSITLGKIMESTLTQHLENAYLAMQTKVRSVSKLAGYPRIDLSYRCNPTAEDFIDFEDDYVIEVEASVMSKLLKF